MRHSENRLIGRAGVVEQLQDEFRPSLL